MAGCAALWLGAPALAQAPAPAAVPAVTLRYDAVADAACAVARREDIAPAWADELQARLPAIQAAWADTGPRLLAAVQAVSGRPLDSRPLTVDLRLCSQPSQAIFGLTVNMRHALASYTPAPVPVRYKLDTAFHEILHGFVARHTPAQSALLAAHADEPACVRNHLHLLALQQAVLLQLGEAPALADVQRIDSQLPSGCYRRAWALLQAAPQGHQGFVAELAP